MSDALAAGRKESRWTRHELVLVARSDWARLLPPKLDRAATYLLTSWADRGWPTIVRRQTNSDPPDSVPVGVPLPPVAGKQRIALSIPETAVIHRQRPPSLGTVKHIVEPDWRKTIDALALLGDRVATVPAAIGSLFWQYRTGLAYLTRQSDLDVLWYVHSHCDVAALLAGIAAIEQTAPMRIDGEIVFADGTAVNWRELYLVLNGIRSGEVLLKSIDGVVLAKVSELSHLRRAA